MQKRCKIPNKSDELLKLLKILATVWQKTWVEKGKRKTERNETLSTALEDAVSHLQIYGPASMCVAVLATVLVSPCE